MTTSRTFRAGPRLRTIDGRGRSRPAVGMLTQDLLELYAEQWLGAADGAGPQGRDLLCFCGRAPQGPRPRKHSNAISDPFPAAAPRWAVLSARPPWVHPRS